MCGAITQPIGLDENGFSYWKLPVSDDLFVCLAKYAEPAHWRLKTNSSKSGNSSLKKTISDSKISEIASVSTVLTDTNNNRWIKISDLTVIIRLVFTCLSDESPLEQKLRRNITNIFLSADRINAYIKADEKALNTEIIDMELAEQSNETEKEGLQQVDTGNNDKEGFSGDEDNESDDENAVVQENIEEAVNDDDASIKSGDEQEVKKQRKGKATTLMLIKKKGTEVPIKRRVLDVESVFDDGEALKANEQDDEDETDDSAYRDYISFSNGRYVYRSCISKFIPFFLEGPMYFI